MPEMIGRAINSCSKATFDVDGRWSEHAVLLKWTSKPAFGCLGAAWQMLRDLNVTSKRCHSLLQKVRLANALG
jgi:hypothetical protein